MVSHHFCCSIDLITINIGILLQFQYLEPLLTPIQKKVPFINDKKNELFFTQLRINFPSHNKSLLQTIKSVAHYHTNNLQKSLQYISQSANKISKLCNITILKYYIDVFNIILHLIVLKVFIFFWCPQQQPAETCRISHS